MPSFKDQSGKEWLVTIDVPAIKLVRARLKDADGKPLDLYRLPEGRMAGLAALLDDPCLLVDTLWVLCEAQAEKSGVTDEQFGRGMAGDVLERAADAFLEALTDFFPSEKARRNLRKVREKQRELTDLLRAEEMSRLDKMDLKAEVAKLMPPPGPPPPSGSSTGTPASAGSSPTAPAGPSES